jgi:hypothetical protein
MTISKEQFAREHLRRAGNNNPSQNSINIYLRLIDENEWVGKLYQRANAMTAEDYLAIPTLEPERNSD